MTQRLAHWMPEEGPDCTDGVLDDAKTSVPVDNSWSLSMATSSVPADFASSSIQSGSMFCTRSADFASSSIQPAGQPQLIVATSLEFRGMLLRAVEDTCHRSSL